MEAGFVRDGFGGEVLRSKRKVGGVEPPTGSGRDSTAKYAPGISSGDGAMKSVPPAQGGWASYSTSANPHKIESLIHPLNANGTDLVFMRARRDIDVGPAG